jgi:hypothetical protein
MASTMAHRLDGGRINYNSEEKKMSNSDNGIDFEQRVKNRAYAIWESEGQPDGEHLGHWQRAQLELVKSEEAQVVCADPAPSLPTAGDNSESSKIPKNASSLRK